MRHSQQISAPLTRSSEYCMTVLGVIFLRHATNRYNDALREIQAEQDTGKMPKRPLNAEIVFSGHISFCDGIGCYRDEGFVTP